VTPVQERRDGSTVGIGETREAADLWQATTNYDKAKAEYEEVLAGPSADEISDARSKVAQAQAQMDDLLADPDLDAVASAEAKLQQSQAQLDSLLAGASAGDLEAAELNVAQAGLNLESAQRQLGDTLLAAPVSGTVIAVEAQAGEAVGANAIIQIVSVDPELVTVDGTPAVQSWASVDLAHQSGSAQPVTLLSGMNAEVEIVAAEARNAVLVPIQALRELGPDQYAVFVVGPSGELELRPVEVGLKDFVNAEILSGLELGEVVSTGSVESSDPADQPSNGGQEPPPNVMRFLGV
jgi:multidrug efflux pump subunit AcrA (membrane-fusion protein)